MKVVFSEAASSEFRDAVEYYAAETEGLAEHFRLEVASAIKRILQFPNGWPKSPVGTFRKCLLNRFPYKIIYNLEEDHILVLAVAHQHRKPDYWVDR